MEPNHVDVLTFTVFRYLEQVNNAEKAGLSRQLRRNLLEPDRLDGIHFDLTFFHAVSVAGFHVGMRPDSDATGYFSATNSLTEALGEDHEKSLHVSAPKRVAVKLRVSKLAWCGLKKREKSG